MPITPRFDIKQTSEDVIVTVQVPNIRVSDDTVEVLLEEEFGILHFHAAPYLLRLNFGGAHSDATPYRFRQGIAEDLSGRLDPIRMTVTIALAKCAPGQHWPRLDLTARLLQPKPQQRSNPRWLQEVIEGGDVEVVNVNDDDDDDDDESDISEDEQHVDGTTMHGDRLLEQRRRTYGFHRMFHGIFTDFAREGIATEMLHLPNPDDTATSDDERYRLRMQREWDDFDPERYIADLSLAKDALADTQQPDDYVYHSAIKMQAHWMVDANAAVGNGDTDAVTADDDNATIVSAIERLSLRDRSTAMHSDAFFTSDEKMLLSAIPYPLLPRSAFSASTIESESASCGPDEFPSTQVTLWCGLIDILFAYVYDHLITQGEPTVESAWTVSTVSSTLSWLEEHDSIGHVVLTSLRRQLIYPYIRNYSFGIYVWRQVARILRDGGRYVIIRCLLQCRRVLEKSEFYYLGNKLYIDPYLAWVQRLDQFVLDRAIHQLVLPELEELINRSSALKNGLGLDIVRYEQMVTQAESETDDSDSDSGESSVSDQTSHSESSDGESSGSSHVRGWQQSRSADDIDRTGSHLDNVNHPASVPDSAMKDTGTSTALLDDRVGDGTNRDIFRIVETATDLDENREKDIGGVNTDTLCEEDEAEPSSLITEVVD